MMIRSLWFQGSWERTKLGSLVQSQYTIAKVVYELESHILDTKTELECVTKSAKKYQKFWTEMFLRGFFSLSKELTI